MNIELAKTFLNVIRAGSFMGAAEYLHITQTTVTTRIHSLEAELECRLFVRNRMGVKLTDDGERFVSFASELVHIWDAACRHIPLSPDPGELLAYGCEASLSTAILLNWSCRLKEEIPEHAFHIEVSDGQVLQNKLELGLLDAALVYRPEYRPGLEVVQLMEDSLIQVASVIQPEPYIYVDWGPSFRKQHDSVFSGPAHPVDSFNLASLALQYILQKGGAAYFRTRAVQAYLNQGLLKRVSNAPEFSYPVYLIYSTRKESPAMMQSFEMLKDMINGESECSLAGSAEYKPLLMPVLNS
jgi:DNA-binding transcriptional LysR family regulator